MLDHPVSDATQRIAHRPAAEGGARKQGSRMLVRPRETAHEVDRPGDIIERNDLARRSGTQVGVVRGAQRLVPDLDLVVLGGIERVALDDRFLRLPDLVHVAQVADRVRRLHELLGRLPEQVVPQPPRGLLLPPVPVEKLGQEPAPLLLDRPFGGVDRNVARQRVDARLRLGLACRQLFGCLAVFRLRARETPALGSDRAGAEVLEPRAEPEGGHAVVAVVGSQLVEQALLPRSQPLLVLHHGEPCLGDRTLALGQVELLDLLERVRLHRGADSLPDDLVEVDEHAAPQKPVDFVLPGRVALHEPLHGRRLVRRVVVDVHRRVPVELRDDEIHERLEGGLLGRAVVGPQRPVGRLSVNLLDHPQQVFEAAVHRPRVGFDVEEGVERAGLGQRREALPRLVLQRRDELVEQASGPAAGELQSSLFAEACQRARIHLGDAPIGRELGEEGQCREMIVAQALLVEPAHPGHERQVVVLAAAVHAHRVPDADRAVVDGLGVGRRRVPVPENSCLEAPLRRPEERRVVGQPVRMRGAVSSHDVDVLWLRALQALQPLGVYAHLDDRRRFHPPRELGVGDLVAPRSETTGGLDTDQEVCVTPPATVEERRLVDDVDAVLHGGQRLRLGRAQLVRSPQLLLADLADALSVRPKALQILALVAIPVLLHELDGGIVGAVRRTLPQALDPAELERREVIAGQVADEICGADDDGPVDELHEAPCCGR